MNKNILFAYSQLTMSTVEKHAQYEIVITTPSVIILQQLCKNIILSTVQTLRVDPVVFSGFDIRGIIS